MWRGVATIAPGDQVLTHLGLAKVTGMTRTGVELIGPAGKVSLSFADMTAREVSSSSGFQAVHQAMSHWWASLDSPTQNTAMAKLEIVLEILTGYRHGWACESLPGEPFTPFGPAFNKSHRHQALVMSERLQHENLPALLRPPTARTIQRWIRSYIDHGLRGLVDGRHTRERKDFDDLDSRYRAIVEQVVSPFDGTISAVNVEELRRRVWLTMKDQNVPRNVVPERLSNEYLAWRYAACGARPRAHRSAKVRKRSAHQPSPIVHPAHVSMDSTRADNLVYDELRQTAYSVEITAIISMSTRVVLALRVTPRSTNSIEAGLCLYDTMRPFSLQVDGTTVDDWRWAGVPRSLESPLFLPRQAQAHDPDTVQGTHRIPGLGPCSIRTDHGAAFMSAYFKGLLADYGISLWPSRVGASTDNSHIERFWETIQRALQQIDGYKGRNTTERGRSVIAADKPLMTARELETHLRRFVALDYHRTQHRGLIIPGLEGHRLSPLEYFDYAMEACGDITVPQHPDLIYDFLPVRWLTIRHAGVEHRGLSYDSEALDNYRHVRNGTFRLDDSAAPFIYDPRDTTRLWFRSPDDGRVHEIPARHQHLLMAPLTDRIREMAIANLARRTANPSLRRNISTQQLIDELGALHTAQAADEWQATMTAERLRFETAQRDHAETVEAWKRVHIASRRTVPPRPTTSPASAWVDEAWPDLEGT